MLNFVYQVNIIVAIGPCQFRFIHVALNGELMVKLISKTYEETEDLVALISDLPFQLLTTRPTHNTLPTSSSVQICSTVPACSTVVTCSTMPMDEAVACSTVATSGTVPVDEATASTVATCGDEPIDGITACTMPIDEVKACNTAITHNATNWMLSSTAQPL